jgi:hypothetical protein
MIAASLGKFLKGSKITSMPKPPKNEDQSREDKNLRRMLNTAPTPHKPLRMPVPSKKELSDASKQLRRGHSSAGRAMAEKAKIMPKKK